MTSNKKKFIVPQLKVHGNVEEITQSSISQGGFDVPRGTIIGLDPSTPIATVTS